MPAAVLCPRCGGPVTPGGGRWVACPQCRETFAAEGARSAPGPPADAAVVFEEIGQDSPSRRTPRRPRPVPGPKPAPESWLTDGDLLDPRRAGRRDWAVTIGTGIMVLVTATLAASEVGAWAARLAAGQAPRPVDFLRPLISLAIVVKLWQGSAVTRAVWCGLCWTATALLYVVSVTVVPPPRVGEIQFLAALLAGFSLALTATLYSPCFTAFLAHRRGER